jgi:hypothetical protein
MMLDMLHGAGIEIVSPAFMNQRPQKEGTRFIPPQVAPPTAPVVPEQAPEELIFDKADEAEKLKQLRLEYDTLREEVSTLEAELKKAGEKNRDALEQEVARSKNRIIAIERLFESAKKQEHE